MTMRLPTAEEKAELGEALAEQLERLHEWPIRLEIMDLKREIVGFGPTNEELFRISIPGSWV